MGLPLRLRGENNPPVNERTMHTQVGEEVGDDLVVHGVMSSSPQYSQGPAPDRVSYRLMAPGLCYTPCHSERKQEPVLEREQTQGNQGGGGSNSEAEMPCPWPLSCPQASSSQSFWHAEHHGWFITMEGGTITF